jgi:hypothetical protein
VETGPALGDVAAIIDGIANSETGNACLHTALDNTQLPDVQIRNGSFVQNQLLREFFSFHDTSPLFGIQKFYRLLLIKRK